MTFSRKVTCPYCGAAERVPAERFSDNLTCGACGRAIFAARPVELTAENFADKLAASELPVLVDFWAAWCGPCKAMAPAFEQAALAHESRVTFAKLDTDAAQQIAAQYDIRSIPTLILFRAGKEVARHSGAMMAAAIGSWLEPHLAMAEDAAAQPISA